jgi:transposase
LPRGTYAEATWTQGLSDWIGSHTRTFAFMGGVPATVVCDNLRSGITRACFYEPAVNRTYAEMAAHYSTTILPARPESKSRLASSSPSCATGNSSRSRH